jgi:hypothetical protein
MTNTASFRRPSKVSLKEIAMASVLRRRFKVILAATLTSLIVIFLTVVAFSLFDAFRSMQTARAHIGESIESLQSANYLSARESIDFAAADIDNAARALSNPAVGVFEPIPWFGKSIKGARAFVVASDSTVEAVSAVVELYGQIAGEAPNSIALVDDGAINISALSALNTPIRLATQNSVAAQQALAQMPSGGPGAGVLKSARDILAERLATVTTALQQTQRLLPRLPVLLGANEPKRYLIAIGNPAESRASGGAPLSLALLEMDNGRMNIVEQGATSTKFFPDNEKILWESVIPTPLGPTPGTSDRFVNANRHPDFTVSGPQMAAAWVAGGYQPVDGVIAMDTIALQSILRAIGPIFIDGYGEVSADNLVQKLLVDSYNTVLDTEGRPDKNRRHELNQKLANQVVAAVASGEVTAAVAYQLLRVAPQRHVQTWLKDGSSQEVLINLGLAGTVSKSTTDQISVFTQNTNGSKVDVFERRSIVHEVELAADGSATVTQIVFLRNSTPTDEVAPIPATEDPTRRDGYFTKWARPAILQYLPLYAENLRVSAPKGWVNEFVADDGQGRRYVQSKGWIEPAGFTRVTLQYSLPPATFAGSGGSLVYSVTMDPQPVLPDVELEVVVKGPRSLQPELVEPWKALGQAAMLKQKFRDSADYQLLWKPR